jgi:hypothetical protein
MSISFAYCVLLCRDLCDGNISGQEESYHLCLCTYVCVCVCVCVLVFYFITGSGLKKRKVQLTAKYIHNEAIFSYINVHAVINQDYELRYLCP